MLIKHKKSQIGIEYLVIMGFVTFVLIGILGVAFFYGGSIKDRLKMIQVNNYANKIISTAESVFYYGVPSKATVRVYLPEGVESIEIIENSLIIAVQLNSGTSKNSYSSDVPIDGSLSINPGIQRVVVSAQEDKIVISTAS